VQDRVFVESEGRTRDAYFRCELPAYALFNVSVSQTFRNMVKVTLGMDNIFNYQPKTLGSGVTMFNIPATPGARGHVQVELMIGEVIQAFRK
jgi:outer membrane receptor protein involved in Fe transport